MNHSLEVMTELSDDTEAEQRKFETYLSLFGLGLGGGLFLIIILSAGGIFCENCNFKSGFKKYVHIS